MGTIELDQARTALDVTTIYGNLAATFADGTTIELLLWRSLQRQLEDA